MSICVSSVVDSTTIRLLPPLLSGLTSGLNVDISTVGKRIGSILIGADPTAMLVSFSCVLARLDSWQDECACLLDRSNGVSTGEDLLGWGTNGSIIWKHDLDVSKPLRVSNMLSIA